jgi:hypothetical protein
VSKALSKAVLKPLLKPRETPEVPPERSRPAGKYCPICVWQHSFA